MCFCKLNKMLLPQFRNYPKPYLMHGMYMPVAINVVVVASYIDCNIKKLRLTLVLLVLILAGSTQ